MRENDGVGIGTRVALGAALMLCGLCVALALLLAVGAL